MGYKEKPNLSTINRVLKRNDLIKKEQKKKGNKESKVYYPEIRAKYPGHIHQVKRIPKLLKGDLPSPEQIKNLLGGV